ncbi:MAG TPA: bifunctional methylenetetrahydrofolate dehydrogenase/methenyltetrahydrofolate cyclohydrolase FolD [Candidatus Merdousia gallistercoris]|nr:bifunctional methylenetetrahydrofolate dehydrogenase/methenyltetrahydrofolate cyclohydrolase FolD [Candidatus Merdousia gallistercoris]
MPQIIDGNATAKIVCEELSAKLKKISAKRPPCVAFIRVGEDPASVSYVKKKGRIAAETGIESRLHVLPESVTQEELFKLIDSLNNDDCVDAILIQAPLPKHLSERDTFNRVRPDKDVDGFSSANLGLLCQEDPRAFTACTPAGIMELLKRYEVPTAGKRVVVIGRSIIVGKPMALLLMKKGADATVTVCHSKSENLKQICAQADIIIAAVGKPMTVTADMVKEGACVIDVGINRIPSEKTKSGYRLVGDVDFENVAPKCSKITPVPGGVGPMTVAMLMSNTVAAYMRHI